jgi:hypothetical protein
VSGETDDWAALGQVWLSDGVESGPGWLMYRARLEEPDTSKEI